LLIKKLAFDGFYPLLEVLYKKSIFVVFKTLKLEMESWLHGRLYFQKENIIGW